MRGEEGLREVEYDFSGTKVKMAVVSGLGNARQLMNNIKEGKAHYDFVEVMACPSGCINGGGQPVSADRLVRKKRTEALYRTDKMLQLHKSQENPYIKDLYDTLLGVPNSHKAHELLHTHYHARTRIKVRPHRAAGKGQRRAAGGDLLWHGLLHPRFAKAAYPVDTIHFSE